MPVLLVYIFILVSYASPSFTQAPSYEEYTTRRGLSQNQVTDIFQDSKGYIWIGTKGGLSRFDGLEFRNFHLADGLPENHVCAISESPSGTIYVLTRSGFAVGDGESFEPFPHPDGSIFQYWSNYGGAYRVTLLNDGSLFISASGHSPIIFQAGKYFSADSLFPGISVYNVYSQFFSADQSRFLFNSVGQSGLLLYNKEGISQVPSTNDKPGYLVFAQGQDVAYHSADTVYVFDGNTLEWKDAFPLDYLHDGILILYVSPDEYYTLKDRNIIIAHRNGQVQTFKFDIPFVTKLFKDREGSIWAVGEGGALKLLSEQFLKVNTDSGAPRFAWTVIEDPSRGIWVGGYGEGLFLHNDNSFKKVEVKDAPDDGTEDYFYMGSTRDRNGHIWMPHALGVVKIENGKARFLKDIPQTFTLGAHEHPINKSMILVHVDSFTVIDTLGNINTYPLLPGNKLGLMVKAMTDKNGITWIGSVSGISLWDGKDIIHLPNEKISFDEGAVSMARDHTGNLWIGNAKGLYLYDYRDSVFRVAPEIISGPVKDLQPIDSTGLFIGMIGKIGLLNLETYYDRGIANVVIYDESNGFMGLEVQQNGSNPASDGSIWFCAYGNIINFNPHRINDPVLLQRQAVIAGVSFLNNDNKWQPVPFKGDKPLVFQNRQNKIRFDFRGISTVKPRDVKYRYKIAELDDTWSEPIRERFVNYTYLPAGSYTFWVDMTMHNGQWSNTPVEIRFMVQQAWWRTLFFRLLAIIILLAMVALLAIKISNAQRKVRWQRLENKQRLAELRLEVLSAQTDPHFLFNILNSAAVSVMKGDREEAYILLTRFARLTRRVFEKKESYYASLSDELKITRDYLELQKHRFKDSFDYSIDVDQDADKKAFLPRMFLQSLAENALKHGVLPSKNGREIAIKVRIKDQNVVVSVEDNGVGRQNAANSNGQGSTGRGLQIIEELFDILNRYNHRKIRLEIDDLEDIKYNTRGTRVSVIIPEDFQFNVLANGEANYAN